MSTSSISARFCSCARCTAARMTVASSSRAETRLQSALQAADGSAHGAHNDGCRRVTGTHSPGILSCAQACQQCERQAGTMSGPRPIIRLEARPSAYLGAQVSSLGSRPSVTFLIYSNASFGENGCINGPARTSRYSRDKGFLLKCNRRRRTPSRPDPRCRSLQDDEPLAALQRPSSMRAAHRAGCLRRDTD